MISPPTAPLTKDRTINPGSAASSVTSARGRWWVVSLVVGAAVLSLWMAWRLGSASALQPDIRFGGVDIAVPLSPDAQSAAPSTGKPA